MFQNPQEEWLQLVERYHQFYDAELLALAETPDDLIPMARQVLAAEMKNRGLERAVEPPKIKREPIAEEELAPEPVRSAGALGYSFPGSPGDPFFSAPGPLLRDLSWEQRVEEEAEGESDEADSAVQKESELTWKTHLCDCETAEEALQLAAALRLKGVDAWAEGPRTSMRWDLHFNRVVVAADQLDLARQIATEPIPAEIVHEQQEESEEEPEYMPPVCPSCQAQDPVLESVKPENHWFCEECGHRWTEASS
ncbi:hypothetical protein ACOBR2_19790 [Telmatobacter bradus]|uniref:hypothetical protein n=1 Tax=Telmatobacter bradus TaxID=474953 RepID=UPI003B43862F